MHSSRLTDHLQRDVPSRTESALPVISVILPVRNEEAYVEQTLQMLLDQEYPRERFEILVVDGMSDDSTRQIVSRFVQAGCPVRLLDNPQQWSSSGRNVGIRQARGDIIVIVDGHCELRNRQHLAHLADAFQRTGADVVGRPQPISTAQASRLQNAIAAARSSPLGHHPDSYHLLRRKTSSFLLRAWVRPIVERCLTNSVTLTSRSMPVRTWSSTIESIGLDYPVFCRPGPRSTTFLARPCSGCFVNWLATGADVSGFIESIPRPSA